MASSGHLDPEDVETLARAAVAEIYPEADLEAMAVVFTLFRAANRIQHDLEREVHRPSGVTWAAFRVLFTIRYTGTVTPLELARLSSVSQASISSVLNTLQRYGLVTRSRSDQDGRVVNVGLTQAGERVVTEMFARHNLRERDWASALSAVEIVTLVALLRKLLAFRPPAPGRSAERLPELVSQGRGRRRTQPLM